MKEGQTVTIHTKNGLEITGIYLSTVSDGEKEWHICYSQNRIVECDDKFQENQSCDLLSMMYVYSLH